MNDQLKDTIVAQITPQGRGAVGIVRVSGVKSSNVAKEILGKVPIPRYIHYASFLDSKKNIIDKGIALWFPGPNSYTGEDVLELQGHGNPIILDVLVKSIISIKDIRIAKPGEFSERAFLNGKLDLIQAESVIDLINATSQYTVKLSLESLQGLFSLRIKKLMDSIKNIRTKLEVSINFPEENIKIDLFQLIPITLKNIISDINKVLDSANKGYIFREGTKVVIAGPTNAGKSTLFNFLTGIDAAIVTDIHGTTRDLLRESVNINGMRFDLVDTAGLRETSDKIENIGIQRAYQEIELAEHILFVVDNTCNQFELSKIYNNFLSSIKNKSKVVIILNKIDLTLESASIKIISGLTFISLSAYTGDGINILYRYLQKKDIGMYENTESVLLARRRHLDLLNKTLNKILISLNNWSNTNDVCVLAEDLRCAQNYLGSVLGCVTTEDILNNIFSEFCIGK
ncbi:tRNA uridine-5-carboxymethylaminomethyl(34) synthesis GTPase MnmE [Buchnera aphidicola (Formosaphis micheliae)]|uniref:tRNA uridine-5-carboxymethylaminomethyl(34) synthesis GTPase MnmE n=1 Tax=Buchnera aphidicola TaxID=9 RepID=UPI0031CC421C